jgi:hypothetical protein
MLSKIEGDAISFVDFEMISREYGNIRQTRDTMNGRHLIYSGRKSAAMSKKIVIATVWPDRAAA